MSLPKNGNKISTLHCSKLHTVSQDENICSLYETVTSSTPISMAEQSKACTVYDHSNIEITGSNPARGMDVCLRLSVLCCPVLVKALCWTDPPTKESYEMSMWIKKSIKEGKRSA
jgi:hypothetical protein